MSSNCLEYSCYNKLMNLLFEVHKRSLFPLYLSKNMDFALLNPKIELCDLKEREYFGQFEEIDTFKVDPRIIREVNLIL